MHLVKVVLIDFKSYISTAVGYALARSEVYEFCHYSPFRKFHIQSSVYNILM